MNNDQMNELLALMGQQIKEQTELRREQPELCETYDHRFVQLTDVMANGLLWLEDQLRARIDNVSGRVDHLTGEVREIGEDVREVKTQGQKINRLGNVFEHTGHPTEASEAAGMRPSYVEEAQLRNASYREEA